MINEKVYEVMNKKVFFEVTFGNIYIKIRVCLTIAFESYVPKAQKIIWNCLFSKHKKKILSKLFFE